MIVGGVDVGPARIDAPYARSREQKRFVAADGTVRVWDIRPEDILLTFTFPRLTKTTRDLLETYLTTTVNYSATPFTLTDDWSVAQTVRWWDSTFRAKELPGRLFEVTATFRVEP